MFNKLLSLFSAQPSANSSVLLHTLIGDRKCNEDALGQVTVHASGKNNKYIGQFLIVCDGMGGHAAGDVTSQTLVNCFIKQVNKLKKPLTSESFITLYERCVAQMQQEFKANHGDIDGHTTLSCAWIDNSQVLTLHVGDSRIYQLNKREVKWRTRDHSVVQMLFDQGEITEAEMGTHPDQNKLFKSISVLSEKLDKPNVKAYPPLQVGESILVCSDGFWEYLSPKELVNLGNKFTQTHLEKTCALSAKRASGKSDNITVAMFKQGTL